MKAVKLPSGSWRARVYLGKDENGKQLFESVTRPTEYECLEEAGRLTKHHHEVIMNPGTMTLEEAINKYISMKSNILSPSTIRGYDSIRKNHLQPEMNMQIRKITSAVMQQAVNREAKDSSPKTVSNIYGVVKTVVKEFTGRELHVTLPQREDPDTMVLSIAECQKLVKSIEGDTAEIPILLALFLGLRRSEIIALSHSDWDSSKKELSISKASVYDKNHRYVVKTTKTRKSKRKIPVSDYLAKKLDRCVEKNIPFCPMHPDNLRKRLNIICKREGLPNIGLHALRHQNASIMLMLGTPDKYAMERGGWSSNSTMKKIYQHTINDKRAAANATINSYLDSLVKEVDTKVDTTEKTD